MTDQPKLPLKVIPPLREDYFTPPGGGSDKIFEEPTTEFREHLIEQIGSVKEYFSSSFEKYPTIPAVAQLKLRPEASAKSHRPAKIFSKNSCPIIGAKGLGSLLISVSPKGLDNIIYSISNDFTIKGKANLSTLLSITPFKPDLDIPEDNSKPLKVKLFRHHNAWPDQELEKTFRNKIIRKFNNVVESEISYGPGLKVFRIVNYNSEIINDISCFVGTQSIAGFPFYQPVRTQAIPVGRISPNNFQPPDPDLEYPTVGIIDTGVVIDDPLLRPWIIGQANYIPDGYSSLGHGTFVAGLIIHSRSLNHNDQRFPSCSSKILDVAAIPKDGLSEDQLLAIIEDVIPKYPHIKYWNLSIGTQNRISEDHFSDFAVALDRIQKEHGITIVLAAGNCNKLPFRVWPPEHDEYDDRLCAPADSIRSIVVGSISHSHNASTASREGQPSPFSRKGPGPMYIPKPDLSHYGGNCSADGKYCQSGIMSIDGTGSLVEDIGTSFSAPLVCTLAANISSLILGDQTSNLSKALLIHSAAQSSHISSPNMLHYRGFGTPPDPIEILQCDSWSCTLIFEIPVITGFGYNKVNFPMPPSLFNAQNIMCADVLMTLVYDPELDASFGSEYCRTNIEVSLGTMQPDGNGNFLHKKQVPEDPKLRGSAYEKDLVTYGFKWSPVKVYRRSFKRFENKNDWRLVLNITHRSGSDLPASQNAALIISISDPNKKAPVYNEVVSMMNRLGWGAFDLQISNRVRI